MIKVTRTEEYLAHHGIKGQKWGVKNGPPYPLKEGAHSSAEKKYAKRSFKTGIVGSKAPDSLSDIPKSTIREAKRDAKEFAEAKMFYGEGAGTRRKRIKEVVNQKSKDPAYKKAYDYYLENQDMAKAASRTRVQRKAADVAKPVERTAKRALSAVIRTATDMIVNNLIGSQSSFASDMWDFSDAEWKSFSKEKKQYIEKATKNDAKYLKEAEKLFNKVVPEINKNRDDYTDEEYIETLTDLYSMCYGAVLIQNQGEIPD